MENKYMRRALELAEIAYQGGDVPVGAVIVENKSGMIIGEGYNTRELKNNPVAHAEIEALQNAAKYLGKWRLDGCSIYVTLEPCPMCSGAIINSRIDRVYFGAYDKKAGAVSSVTEMFRLPFNHRPECYEGIMEKECSAILSDFFSHIRTK